jgi:hypothetical protein
VDSLLDPRNSAMIRVALLATAAAIAFALTSCGADLADRTASAPVPDSAAGTGAIGSFGTPADPAQRAALTTALRAYLVALASGDGTAACSRLAAPLRAQLLSLGPGGGSGQHRSCAQTLASMYGQEPPQTRMAQRHTAIGSIRVEKDRAFVLYRQPGAPPGFFPLQREGGHWRVAALGGTVLPTSHG